MITYFLSNLTYRRIALLQAFTATTALSLALISQYGFHLHPCSLCLMQRYPYAIIMALGVLAVSRKWTDRTLFCIALACSILFAVDAGIAFYHTGVELDIFAGPDGCSNAQASGQTLEAMREAIRNAPLVSCKQAMAYFFGISMAAWNGLAASFFATLSLLGIRYVRRTAR